MGPGEIPIYKDPTSGQEVGGEQYVGITVVYGKTGMTEQEKLDYHREIKDHFTAAKLRVVEEKDEAGNFVAIRGISETKTSF